MPMWDAVSPSAPIAAALPAMTRLQSQRISFKHLSPNG
jgi:hypothetical protein